MFGYMVIARSILASAESRTYIGRLVGPSQVPQPKLHSQLENLTRLVPALIGKMAAKSIWRKIQDHG